MGFRARQYLAEVAKAEFAKLGKEPARVVVQDDTLKKHPMMTKCRIELTGFATEGNGGDGGVEDRSPLMLLAEEAVDKQRQTETAMRGLSSSLASAREQMSRAATANQNALNAAKVSHSLDNNTNASNRLNSGYRPAPVYTPAPSYRLTPTYGGGFRATPY